MKPTFLVLGAAKAGSSTLCHLLGLHPEVFMSPKKEVHYFSFEPTWAKGADWYEAWFEGADPSQQRGEGSTSYSVRNVFPEAARRIAEYDPTLRLIYIARHPLERMESAWLQLRRFGVRSPFEDVGMVELPDALRTDADFATALREQTASIVDSTNYWREIDRYRALFPDERIHVLLLDDLQRDPRGTLSRVFEFLGVDPTFEPPSDGVHLNSKDGYLLVRPTWTRLVSTPRTRAAYRAASRVLPGAWKQAFSRRFLRKPVDGAPRWDADSLAFVRERLEADLGTFLEFYGYPADTWSWSREGASAR